MSTYNTQNDSVNVNWGAWKFNMLIKSEAEIRLQFTEENNTF